MGFSCLYRSSDSLDEYICELRGLGYELEACQLDQEKTPSTVSIATSEALTITRFDIGNRTHHLLKCPVGYRTFGVLARDQAPSQIRGRPLATDYVLVADPDIGVDAVNEPGFSVFAITIAEERLLEAAEFHEFSKTGELLRGVGMAKPASTELTTSIRQLCQQALLHGGEIPEVASHTQTDLPVALLSAWDDGDPLVRSRRANASTRQRALQRAVDFLRSSGPEVLSVEQLCRESATSYSTLERAFREYFGISPKQYMVYSRLAGARRALLECGGESSVSEVAHGWGFSHMSKFAADYSRLFGELPSATLRAA